MDKRYLIFVSSTFSDLKDERRKVMEQILNMGHFPIGMELFHASNQDQWSYIERRIKDCDYYLLIVGERYGSVANDNMSYTEKEFDLALVCGVPISAHLISPEARKLVAQEHVQFDKKEELDRFRQKAQSGRIVKYWNDGNELALNVANALSEQFRDEPRVGLVRGDQAMMPQVTNEIARLSGENEALRASLSKYTLNFDPELDELIQTYSTTIIQKYFLEVYQCYIKPDVTLNDLLVMILQKFGLATSEGEFKSMIYDEAVLSATLPSTFHLEEELGVKNHPFWAAFNDGAAKLSKILIVSEILLAENSRMSGGRWEYPYSLTEIGKRYLKKVVGVSGVVNFDIVAPNAA